MNTLNLARPPLLEYDEAATYLGCSRRTVERLAAAGHLRPVRIGNRVRYHQADLDACIASGGATTKPVPQ